MRNQLRNNPPIRQQIGQRKIPRRQHRSRDQKQQRIALLIENHHGLELLRNLQRHRPALHQRDITPANHRIRIRRHNPQTLRPPVHTRIPRPPQSIRHFIIRRRNHAHRPRKLLPQLQKRFQQNRKVPIQLIRPRPRHHRNPRMPIAKRRRPHINRLRIQRMIKQKVPHKSRRHIPLLEKLNLKRQHAQKHVRPPPQFVNPPPSPRPHLRRNQVNHLLPRCLRDITNRPIRRGRVNRNMRNHRRVTLRILAQPRFNPLVDAVMLNDLRGPRHAHHRVIARALNHRRPRAMHLGSAPRINRMRRIAPLQLRNDRARVIVAARLKRCKE